MNSCSSYIISFNLYFQNIQKYSCDSEVAITSEVSHSFILQCIKLINLSEAKIIIGLSEGYINTIKHKIKTEPEFNNLVLFLILFLFY